ncbi:neuraminidase-like domain-containing protein [Arenimonas sp.]|uniref:Tc toxin subunit A-related protein n=1 Tax=Arenimonas sp. TaxID=1872635 RepID=UPI0025C2622B|nr:neuraminidase-like domain-containing protein [Arenimonas sp.]
MPDSLSTRAASHFRPSRPPENCVMPVTTRTYFASGQVLDPDGRPVPDILVTAIWPRLRGEQQLAEGRTDARGAFKLALKIPADAPVSMRARVCALAAVNEPKPGSKARTRKSGQGGEPLPQACSEVLPVAELEDLTLRLAPLENDEHSAFLARLAPALGKMPLADLVEDDQHGDIAFLAAELSISSEVIMRLVVAERVADRLKIPAAVVYGFLRLGVPAGLPQPLLEASDRFKMIDALVAHIGDRLVALDEPLLATTLKRSFGGRIIPSSLAPSSDMLLARFAALREARSLDAPFGTGKTVLSSLLGVAGLPTDKQGRFVTRWQAHAGSANRFWEALAEKDSGFEPAEVESLRRTLDVGALVKNHLPMLQAVTRHLDETKEDGLPSLARLDFEDWLKLVRAAGKEGVPPNIQASGEDSPEVLYAREIHERVQRRYPTSALAVQIERKQLAPKKVQASLAAFYRNSPGLDLTRANLGRWLEDHGEKAFEGITPAARASVVKEVERMQRVIRISRDARVGATLIEAGLDSAASLQALGRRQIAGILTKHGLSPVEANRIHEVAQMRHAASMAMMIQYNRALSGIYPAATGPAAPFGEPIESAIKRNPSLANLFGSQDTCAVDPCTSILSPSAYVTDLLLWLRNRRLSPSGAPATTALAVLASRRPDLLHLKLDCANTNTPLPYIDLVNELLEDAVAPPATPLRRQTTRSAAELRALPEHVNDAAYVELATACFPHYLPYDRPFDELSTLLARSDLPFWQLRQAADSVGVAPTPAQASRLAAARFSMPAFEQALVTGTSGKTLAEVWNSATPRIDLEPVAAFLSSAQLGYDELRQLLDCRWIHGSGAAISISGVDDSCDTSSQRLVGLDDSRLDRIHRFLRLWRRVPWAMWELDELILCSAVGAGDITDATLAALFTVDRLQAATELPIERLVALWQDIGTTPRLLADGEVLPSLYSRLFEDPLLPPDPALALPTLLTAAPPAALVDHLETIRAALSLSPDEAAVLAGATDGELTLANLGIIHRRVQLARALRLGQDDAAYLAGGSFTAAFSSPAASLAFAERTVEIVSAGLALPTLRHVLTHDATGAGRAVPQLSETITAVRLALQQVNDDVVNAGDPLVATLERQLATLPSLRVGTLLATAMAIVDGSFSGSAGDRNAFIATHFAAFMGITAAQAALALPLASPAVPPGPREAEIATRAQALLTPLVAWLTETRVITAVAGGFSLADDIAARLLRDLNRPGTSSPLLATLTDPALIARDPVTGAYLQDVTPTAMPEAFDAMRVLDKVSLVVRGLRLSHDELSWQLAHAADIGAADLAALPVLPGQPAVLLAAWQVTTRFVLLDRAFDRLALSNQVPVPAIASLRDLVAAIVSGGLATDAAIHAALAAITGWRPSDVATAAARMGIVLTVGPGTPAWLNVESYERLRRILRMTLVTGASATQLLDWGSAPAPTQAQANEAWQALRSRYASEEWLALAPSIMDPLRIRRRDALRWWLLGRRDSAGVPVWGVDSADLFGRFLLDVEMSPCQVTTRVVQAYASIQLFVQRALMNLERDVVADPDVDDGWDQWRWMSRYRVWEAGRKVFLWPENWLMEPQRPTRSEIFVALDHEMSQRESTKDALETAALGYLDRLSGVARLRVTGMCSEPRTGNLYVVGRSPGDPAEYFLRRFAHRQWSPWTKIPVEIATQNATPAFYAGRLHLFWMQAFVTPEPQQRLPPASTGPARDSEQADRHVELRVYASSFRDGTWTPPGVAGQSLFDKPYFYAGQTTNDADVERLYTLKVQPSGSSLLIDVFRVGPTTIDDVIRAAIAGILGASDSLTVDHAVHLGRAVFDGRFGSLQLRDLRVDAGTGPTNLLERARLLYGPRASDLIVLPEPQAEPRLPPEPGMRPEAGSLVAHQTASSTAATDELSFQATVTTGVLLARVPLPFRVAGLANDLPFTPESPFVLNDPQRSWFVEPTRYWRHGSLWNTVPPSVPGSLPTQLRFTFTRFYHPFVRTFRHVLSSGGFEAFFAPALQRDPGAVLPDPAPFAFNTTYGPVATRVRWGSNTDTVDFNYDAPYAGYNWELFLHLPLAVANRLAQNQRFEEARDWFHHVFNPTRASVEPVPQRYWITRPLAELNSTAVLASRIDQLLAAVNRRDPAAVGQVERWRTDPFNPYLLADLRPVAYMKRVVMSYLDNLIAWGDALFATNSREALNEATLLYVVAGEILGPKPQQVPPPARAAASWTELEPQLDAMANALVNIENLVPSGTGTGGGAGGPPLPSPQTFYFKIPPNEKLLAYWDTVADRLFKLRHCRGLGGEELLLALFDAPIDPALLVRARAGGMDLGSVLRSLAAPLPHYRFTELHQRALDYTSAVQSLGNDLLGALESRDGAALDALLVSQRRRVQADTGQILKWQIEEAKALKKAVEYAIEWADYRKESAESAPFMSELEITAVTMKSLLVALKLGVVVGKLIAGGIGAIPGFLIGAAGIGGSPQAGATTGGPPISEAMMKGIGAGEKFIESVDKGAEIVKTFAEAEKKAKEYKKLAKEAEYDIKTGSQELAAAELKVLIAERQLELHEKAAADLDSERDYLQSRFGSEALYDWMVGQLSTVYFSAYRLATAMAHRAERCYRFELGLVESSLIGPGSWDSLRRGLLAGEHLAHDLRRLESSYLELNGRRKEITRTVSMLEEFPDRLFTLLTTGTCELPLDERLFDRDYPGHYQRRLARVGITVARPGASEDDNVVCVATLLANSVRLQPAIGSGYPRQPAPAADPRFADQFAAVQGIVTGNAINDPGVFRRDIGGSLSDPRYVPFENAGAIGLWKLELPASRNALDLSTVKDVKLHLHYTALDGGPALAQAAQAAVHAAAPASVVVAFDAMEDFPEAWEALMAGGGSTQTFMLPLRRGLLPPVARGRTAMITQCELKLFSDDGGSFEVALLAPFPTASQIATPVSANAILSSATFAVPSLALQPLSLRVRRQGASDWTSLSPGDLRGMVVAVHLALS